MTPSTSMTWSAKRSEQSSGSSSHKSRLSGPFVCGQHAAQTVLGLEPLFVRADRIADCTALEVRDGYDGTVDQVEAGVAELDENHPPVAGVGVAHRSTNR